MSGQSVFWFVCNAFAAALNAAMYASTEQPFFAGATVFNGLLALTLLAVDR